MKFLALNVVICDLFFFLKQQAASQLSLEWDKTNKND